MLYVVGARAPSTLTWRLPHACPRCRNLAMYNVKVTFGNGQTFSPDTRIQFHEGSWSRTIDLPGPVRMLRRVDFWYRSRLRRGVATVRLFGKK